MTDPSRPPTFANPPTAATPAGHFSDDCQALVSVMEQGIVCQSADGRITAANQAAERILGLSLDQMQERTSMVSG